MESRERIFSEIVINNVSRERHTLSRNACKSYRGIRKDPYREKVTDRENLRPVFFHDTDKILHSRAYSRYIDKTQVFCLFENDHVTHRVLHVQLVSKIGRVIGRCLKLNEDLIEAIALGHDLGHVPYGHDGEKILNDLCTREGIGCFCHNAQSVRLLMEYEEKGKGLNLSLQVLDGILAHNGERPLERYDPYYEKTWDIFDQEYRDCFEIANYGTNIVPMTLEGCLVKIADVIAYIGRDIEDAITLNVIGKRDIPRAVRRVLGFPNDRIINTLVLDLVEHSYNQKYLAFSSDVYKALADLLIFNIENIYTNPKINTEADKIKNMYEQLFSRYLEYLRSNCRDSDIYQSVHDMDDKYLKTTDDRRLVVDFIAGMTDDYFYNQYQKTFIPQSYGYALG